jgi:glycosyltransferase involved in cell wall biosynthesis
MRVLFVDQFSQWGGAQFMLRDTMVEALRRGWHVEFIAPGNGGLFEFCNAQSIPSHHLDFRVYTSGGKSLSDLLGYPRDIASAAKNIREVVSGSRIDLLVANGPRILPAAAVAASCPLVFHVHNRLDRYYARAIVQVSLRRSRATTVCSSEFVAEPLRALARRNSPHILLNGVEDCGYEPDHLRSGPPTITILGRIAPEKGHFDFLHAAEIVAQSRPDVRFAVHGTSSFSDSSYERQIRASVNHPAVTFYGWSDDIASVLHKTDILVVPSTGIDATPRVIMEAFSAGTPVIAYPSGGIRELIRHGHTGLLTDRPHHASLARSIQTLLSQPATAAHLALNARREWERRFRVDRFQRDMCDLLERSAEKCGQAQSAPAVTRKNDLA